MSPTIGDVTLGICRRSTRRYETRTGVISEVSVRHSGFGKREQKQLDMRDGVRVPVLSTLD